MKRVGGNKQRWGRPFLTVVVRVEVARRRTPGSSLRPSVRSQATLIYVVAIYDVASIWNDNFGLKQ